MRESVLGQMAVWPPQLRVALHQGSGELQVPMQLMDYANWIHDYMFSVLDLAMPIM